MERPHPPPILEVRFEGEGINPDTIPLGILSRVFGAIHRLATEPEEKKGERELGPFRLIGVGYGSGIYKLAGESAGPAINRLKLAGNILKYPDQIDDNDSILNPIEELSAAAEKIKCTVTIKEPGERGEVFATISPTSYKEITEFAFIHGDTSVSGEIKGVGGATEMRCRLRVPFQKDLLYCKIRSQDVDLARELGNYLYQDVVVYGTASWLKSNWKMVGLEIRDLRKPKGGTLSEAIEAIREAGAKDWDKIGDVASYMEETSGTR